MKNPESQLEINRSQVSPEMKQHLDFYNKHREKLIDAAAKIRSEAAASHRGFYVGAAVLTAKKKGDTYFYDAYAGANYTPIKKEPPEKGPNKRCAERNGVDMALEDEGVEVITAILTISDQKGTGDATHAHDALHPCLDCRQMIRGLLATGKLREDSIICNVNDSDKTGRLKTEEQTVKNLLSLYADDPPLVKDPSKPEWL